MLEEQLAEANERFIALVERVNALEASEARYRASLDLLLTHSTFFTSLVTHLEPKFSAIEQTHDSLESRIEAIELDSPVGQLVFEESLQDIQAQMLALKVNSTPISPPTTPRPRAALPEVFSGKREDWKSFKSHLDLFFMTHGSAYPTDSDKIMFAISRLGTDTSAFKMMETYIPKFRGLPELRPALITNLEVFLDFMNKNFGVVNSHIVAEISLRNLKQKGSALDYTNKFMNIAADISWNDHDGAMISAYRLGLKESVLEILARDKEPTTFAEFTQLAIEIDTRQYSYFLTRPSTRTSSSSSSAPVTRSNLNHQTPRTPAPAATETGPTMMDLGQAQHRPITAVEKQRRKDANLCGYCGAEDHWIRDCPLKTAGKKTVSAMSTVQTSMNPDVIFDLGKDNA